VAKREFDEIGRIDHKTDAQELEKKLIQAAF
jgi:hypothetical protein